MSKSKTHNPVFGDLLENLASQKKEPTAKYPIRTIVASLFLMLVHNPLRFLGTGFTVMMLWNWFVPLIGVTTITFPIALGFCLIVGLITWRESFATSEDEKERLTKALLEIPIATSIVQFGITFFRLGFALGCGYLVHLFV